MQGRDIFAKYKRLITIIVKCDSILPTKLNLFLLICCRNTKGKIGAFMRYILIHNLSFYCGDNVMIKEGVYLYGIQNLSFGDNVSIHPMCYIDATGGIDIGNDVSIAHNTTILSTSHTYKDLSCPIKYNEVTLKKTIIKDDVWIACGVRILSGITIESRSIIAAGSIVTKDVPNNVIYGGCPAKFIKNI